MLRMITCLISTACLFILVFTDLTITQRLLLIGVILFDAVDQWSRFLEARRK